MLDIFLCYKTIRGTYTAGRGRPAPRNPAHARGIDTRLPRNHSAVPRRMAHTTLPRLSYRSRFVRSYRICCPVSRKLLRRPIGARKGKESTFDQLIVEVDSPCPSIPSYRDPILHCIPCGPRVYPAALRTILPEQALARLRRAMRHAYLLACAALRLPTYLVGVLLQFWSAS